MRTRRLFTWILLLVLSTAATPVAAADPTASEVDAIFADYDRTTSPGCSLGVIRDGALIYTRGYGMANLEYGIALSPSSVFRTASVGKQFTAMAIAILDEQGVLSLDDPLSRFFPEFPSWAEEITVRHLVHHTSGIRDYLTLAWLAGMGDEAYYTDEYALDLLSRQDRLNFSPGDDHLYSNSGYLLLAHIVKRATDQTLREWAAENMFGPLGMHDSHFHDDHTAIVPNRADGYAPTEDGYRISMTTLDMVGDGGVYTTVEDFLLWDRNFYENRLGKGGPDLIETVTTPGTLNHDAPMTYAFGLDVEEYRGLPSVSHGGAFVGFRTDTLRFPEQRFSVVVYCNRADADPSALTREVAALYLSELLAPPAGPTGVDPKKVQGAEISASDLKKLPGHFWSAEERRTLEIVTDERLLFIQFSEGSRFELLPLDESRFSVAGLWFAAEVHFEKDEDGRLRMGYLTESAEEPRMFDRFVPSQPTAENLASYAGTYESAELDVDYELEVVEERLRFKIHRHEAHELEPLFGEVFANEDYGTFEFQRGLDGTVEGFTLDAGRVRGLDFVRR